MVSISKKIFLKAITIIVLASGTLFAESGFFQIAEVPVTARNSAMGGTGAALSGGGFGVYNPASPAFAEAPFLTFEFGREPGELSKARIETSWMFPKWFTGVSLQVRSTGFYITDEQTDETTIGSAPSFNQSVQGTVTGGYVFGRCAAGGSINFFQERIGDQAWQAFTFSPGVVFELVPNSVTLGASLSHYLRVDTAGSPWYKTPVTWYRSARNNAFPRYARGGVAWRDTLWRWSMPFTAACDFVYSDVYERLMTPVGAEVWVLPSIAARAGVCINHPADIVHFGVGFRFQNMRFDFDYGVFQAVSDAEAKWQFGLTYLLKKNKVPAPSPIKKEPAVPGAPEPVKAVPPSAPTSVPPKDSLLLPSDVQDTILR
jgi:hypothetical protein